MPPGGGDLRKALSIRSIMMKPVSWQMGISFRQHHLFINNPSVHVLQPVQWILNAPVPLHHVLGNFLSVLLCLMAILFQNEHK